MMTPKLWQLDFEGKMKSVRQEIVREVTKTTTPKVKFTVENVRHCSSCYLSHLLVAQIFIIFYKYK